MKSKIFLIMTLVCAMAFCEKGLYSWDFVDCSLKDILFAVSMDTGISISADDTVNGRGTFRFAGKDFETAFDAFLNSERLFVEKKEDLWTVSKIKITKAEGLVSVEAFDLSAGQIVEKISGAFSNVVTFDSLPGGTFSVHFKNMSEKELLENLVKRFNGYELTDEGKRFHIGKVSGSGNGTVNGTGFVQVKALENGGFLIDAKDCRAIEVLNKLFDCVQLKEKKEFCFLGGTDAKVLRCSFREDSFDKTLEVFCSQNGLESFFVDGVYYVLSEGNSGNKVLSGSRKWEKIKLDFVKAEKFCSVLNRRLGKTEVIMLGDEYSFLAYLSEKEMEVLEELKKDVDFRTENFLVELKYIKPEELKKRMAGSGNKEKIWIAEDNSLVYFTGTEKGFEDFKKELEIIDRPVQRISYDLLILEFDESEEEIFGGNLSIKNLSSGDRNSLGVTLGNVLGLNFNVISTFGIDFAGKLDASIEKNKTRVFADTTLWGVSGKQISFKNTSTYRYRDNNLDPETGKPVYSGVTKEIISGLRLEVMGFISGDGMITSTVTASVTRQGNDTSSSTGNPPPTTEKVITTEVCGKSGEPVVLSGLIENQESESKSHTPLLCKIPILGNLFKSKEKTVQKTQMVIYLIPRLQNYGESFEKAAQPEKEWALEKCNELVEIEMERKENE